jgi:hypothetical protein
VGIRQVPICAFANHVDAGAAYRGSISAPLIAVGALIADRAIGGGVALELVAWQPGDGLVGDRRVPGLAVQAYGVSMSSSHVLFPVAVEARHQLGVAGLAADAIQQLSAHGGQLPTLLFIMREYRANLLDVEAQLGIHLFGRLVRLMAVMQGLYCVLECQCRQDTDDDHKVFTSEFFPVSGFRDFRMHGDTSLR